MAQFAHLSVYKTAYTFLVELVQTTKNCPKEFKYSIAEKMQQISVDLILDIYRANSSIDKIPHLEHLLENVEMLNIYLRMCFDLQIISIEKYTVFIEKSGSIAKQTKGWLQACKKN